MYLWGDFWESSTGIELNHLVSSLIKKSEKELGPALHKELGRLKAFYLDLKALSHIPEDIVKMWKVQEGRTRRTQKTGDSKLNLLVQYENHISEYYEQGLTQKLLDRLECLKQYMREYEPLLEKKRGSIYGHICKLFSILGNAYLDDSHIDEYISIRSQKQKAKEIVYLNSFFLIMSNCHGKDFKIMGANWINSKIDETTKYLCIVVNTLGPAHWQWLHVDL